MNRYVYYILHVPVFIYIPVYLSLHVCKCSNKYEVCVHTNTVGVPGTGTSLFTINHVLLTSGRTLHCYECTRVQVPRGTCVYMCTYTTPHFVRLSLPVKPSLQKHIDKLYNQPYHHHNMGQQHQGQRPIGGLKHRTVGQLNITVG
jgi:hypothetical protein